MPKFFELESMIKMFFKISWRMPRVLQNCKIRIFEMDLITMSTFLCFKAVHLLGVIRGVSVSEF